MFNVQIVNSDLQKYLKKLQAVIATQATFSFMGFQMVEKDKINDLLCCIQSCIPKQYEKYNKIAVHQPLRSKALYNSLLVCLQRKPFFIKNLYMIRSNQAYALITSLQSTFPFDINIVTKDMSEHPDRYN